MKIKTQYGIHSGLMLFVALVAGPSCAARGEGLDAPVPKVPAGYDLVEGDILVPNATNSRVAAKSTFPNQTVMFWPNGVVPYIFDGNVTPTHQNAMLEAMTVWQGVANVHFRPWQTGDFFSIHIYNSDGNSSIIGRVGPEQPVRIFDWDSTYTIAHELGHALGFWHEQSRSDRDAYIQVNAGNIQSGEADQFAKHDEASHYGPYDFDSVMHYGRYDFSGNGLPTITVLPPNDAEWQDRIGQRDHLSQFDVLTMSFLYPQPNWRFVDGAYSGIETGTFLDPFSDFLNGVTQVPSGGTLWIQPAAYTVPATYTFRTPMTWRAPLGGVTIR